MLPWHGREQAARDAYAAQLRGYAAYLRDVEADAAGLYVSRPELTAGQDRSRAAMLRVVISEPDRERVRELLP